MAIEDRLDLETAVTERWSQKRLVLAGFGAALALVWILLQTPPADGYEVSVYAAYPWYFWGLVVLAFLLGAAVVFRDALPGGRPTGEWRLGFHLLLLVNAVLVFMPYVRGYPLYGRGDVLTHLGYVREIETTGGDPFLNIYQSVHQVTLALSYATGVEPIHVINAVAGVVSLFSLLASYALLATVFDRQRALLTLPFVAVLVGGRAHLNPSPFAQSVLLLPFVLYLLVRSQRTDSVAVRLSMAVAAIAAVTYHPLTAVFLLLVFLVHYGVAFATGRGDPGSSLGTSAVASKTVLQLTAVTFVAWYYNFVGILIRFQTVIERFVSSDSGETTLDAYASTVNEFSPALVDLAAVGLVKYGQTAAFLGIGVVFVASLGRTVLRRRPLATPYLLTFGVGFVLFSALGVLFLLVDLIGGFGRPLMFARYFAAFAAGSLLAEAYATVDRRRAVTAAAALVFVALVVLSVGGLYHTPVAGESTAQVTGSDLDGAAWYLDNGQETAPLLEIGTTMYRFEHALNGTNSTTLPRDRTRPPPHFNYTTHATLGESYDRAHYLVVTERGEVFFPVTYPDYREFWRFTPVDFDRLERDPSVSHVYGNGEFDLYVVRPVDGP